MGVWIPKGMTAAEPDVVCVGAMAVLVEEIDRIERSAYAGCAETNKTLAVLGDAFQKLARERG